VTSFHVRHDFNPAVARDVLLLLRMASTPNEAELLVRARARDLEIGRRQSVAKVVASLRDLGLVEHPLSEQRGNIRLTTIGHQVADVAVRDELLLAELIHLRYWWLWTPECGGAMFAWAYQTVAGMLWDEASMPIDNNRLVGIVLAAAEQQFHIRGISFSASSVLGILYWLRALSPTCIVGGTFRRRPTCPPEALMIALEGMYSVIGHPLGSSLRLDSATRDRVCRSVLLEIEAFDEVLSQAEAALGLIRRHGASGDMVLIRESLFPGLILQRKSA
jgi:hypothetical protein